MIKLDKNHDLVKQIVSKDTRYGTINHEYWIHCDVNFILGNPPIHLKFTTKCINVMTKCPNCNDNLRINNSKIVIVPTEFYEIEEVKHAIINKKASLSPEGQEGGKVSGVINYLQFNYTTHNILRIKV